MTGLLESYRFFLGLTGSRAKAIRATAERILDLFLIWLHATHSPVKAVRRAWEWGRR